MLASAPLKIRPRGRDHHGGKILGAEGTGIADVDPEAFQHRLQALPGEGGVGQAVAGAIQADHEAIADQHVVADAFEVGDILDAGTGLGRAAGQGSQQEAAGQGRLGQAAQQGLGPMTGEAGHFASSFTLAAIKAASRHEVCEARANG